MVNKIDNLFADIGGKLANIECLLNLNQEFNEDFHEFRFLQATGEEVGKLLKIMTNNRSTGIDGIPIGFLNLYSTVSVKIFVFIANPSDGDGHSFGFTTSS